MALQGETTNREFRYGSLISLLSDNRKEFKKRTTRTGNLDNRRKCLSLQLLRVSKCLAAADVRSFAVTTVLSLRLVGSSGGVVASISRLASL